MQAITGTWSEGRCQLRASDKTSIEVAERLSSGSSHM
jgi:hypothetical protein